jgi:HlyD family secretion protein
MEIDTSFAEADIAKIQVGQSVKFSVDAYPHNNFVGVVKQIRLNPVNTANVVTYNIVILVENQEKLLLPGMTAYVTVNFAHHEKVLLVPNAALRYQPKNEDFNFTGKKNETFRNGDRAKKEGYGSGKIYTLRDNKPLMIKVNTGITNGKLTEVMSSEIKENDLVITGDLVSDQKPRSGAQGPNRPPRVF